MDPAVATKEKWMGEERGVVVTTSSVFAPLIRYRGLPLEREMATEVRWRWQGGRRRRGDGENGEGEGRGSGRGRTAMQMCALLTKISNLSLLSQPANSGWRD